MFCAQCYFDLCTTCAHSEARADELLALRRTRSRELADAAEAAAAEIAEAKIIQDAARRYTRVEDARA